jgi:hypothetical protein
MPCAQGALGRLAMKEGSGAIDFSTGASFFPFYRESIKKVGKIVHPDVIIGSREEVSERARKAPYFYGGWVVINLTPGDAATVFPWILGADASGTTFALAETLQSMGVLIDKVTGVHEFYNGVINRAIISGRQNGPGGRPNWVTVAMQMYFRSYLAPGASESFPSPTFAVTGEYAPMIFEDADNGGTSRLVINGTAREVKEFTLDINNYVSPRWVNALEPTALCPGRRTINLRTIHPYDSGTSNLYDPGVTLSGTNTLTFVNGATSVLFTFAGLNVDVETPEIRGKQEIDLVLNSAVRKVSSTSSLVCTIDSTP